MKDCREEWYDKDAKVAVTIVDVTSAAQELARGHLAGPTAAHYLTEALASVALLGAEMSEKDETVILQAKCSGPLGGYNVECTAAGTLRGYTEKKVLDDFDPTPLRSASAGAKKILGEQRIQVTRSVPGKILSQGISASLDGYLAGSLQRKACIRTEVVVSDEVEILEARGILVEILPDSKLGSLGSDRVGIESDSVPTDPLLTLLDPKHPVKLAVASRNILKQLGLEKAELRKTTPLKFACRCSPDRAIAMLAALSEEERRALPPTIDITCHMCGKTFTVKTKE